MWRVLNPILIAHGIFSLAKDSILLGEWTHEVAESLRIPERTLEAIGRLTDIAVDTYRAIIWPLINWIDIALRDLVFVIAIIYGPTLIAGVVAIANAWIGRPAKPVFQSALNRQLYVQCIVSAVLGLRALDTPATYIQVITILCFLTPLQFIRHLDQRLPFGYGFKESRDTTIGYFVFVGIPYSLIIHPFFQAHPREGAIALSAGAAAMLAASLILTLRDAFRSHKSKAKALR